MTSFLFFSIAKKNNKQTTTQSPKYAPPMEFVDQAALSPPEGYKDGLQALGGVLGSHIFGAQHYQQLQVIQQLQAQRAAMIAAQRANNNTNQKSSSKTHTTVPPPPPPNSQTVCTECAECTECAAKQEHDEGKYLRKQKEKNLI